MGSAHSRGGRPGSNLFASDSENRVGGLTGDRRGAGKTYEVSAGATPAPTCAAAGGGRAFLGDYP